MKIAVVILNWNGKNDTLECLASLRHLHYSDYLVVVVDNGSTDGSKEAIRIVHPEVHMIAEEKNLGFAGGCNIGMKFALAQGADAICLLNNDAIVDPFVLTHFAQRAQQDPDTGILGAQILMYSDPTRLDHLGGRWNSLSATFTMIGHGQKASDFFWNEGDEIDYACGAALFIKKEVIEKIGLFEEKFFLFWEETDFCCRAKKAGFTVKVCLAAKIYHKISSSFTCKAHQTYFFHRNRLLWMERNLSREEFVAACKKVINPEIRKTKKHLILRSIQSFFHKHLLGKPRDQSLEQKLIGYRAILAANSDFHKKKFGDGPSWIYKNQ